MSVEVGDSPLRNRLAPRNIHCEKVVILSEVEGPRLVA
jgi:hypothetical protein